jgi:ligand-binding sensor domain-containing protein
MTSFLRWVRRFSVLVALLVLSQSAWCLDPAVPLSDYNHRIWTTRDGAPAHVDVIAQTPDGWLWFGGKGGLTRFDGVRFYPYVPPAGSQLLSEQITTLVAESNGDLYIGYSFGGLTVRHADGRLEHLAQKGKKGPSHAILNLLVDTDGSIWTGTTGGLMHYSSGTWTKMDLAQGYDNWTTFILDLDARGRLWVGNNVHMFLFDRDRQRFVDRTQAILDIGRRDHANFRSTVMSPDGRLWMGDEKGKCRR